MSLHFEPILSGVSYSIKPKSQTPHLKFHHYWLEYGWEYRCAYKSTDWSNNRCWRTIHWGRSPLLCATEIAGSCLVYLFAQKLNWMDTKFNINWKVRRHFVPGTNCPTALCTSPETYCPYWCTLPGDILSHFLNMNPHTLGKACAYLRHILDISWAIFGHICGIYVRKPLFNWHF